MRIGTWNLAGRWSPEHEALIRARGADVWLLTEVSEGTHVAGYDLHLSEALMAAKRRWAGVLARSDLALAPQADPHPASALAHVEGLSFCSSILPWRSCGTRGPWVGTSHAEKTKIAVEELLAHLPAQGLVWGGDWNHALSGPECAGSKAGREVILECLSRLGLEVPTARAPHRIEGLLSIDHIAVPGDWAIDSMTRVAAAVEARRLSDHDAYVVEAEPPLV
jgi:endonuclease/exonuclease/phosphatase family metal-dependent hydrolase